MPNIIDIVRDGESKSKAPHVFSRTMNLIIAERDRLREQNTTLVEALKDAQSRLTNILAHANHLVPCNHDFCERVNSALAHLCVAVDVAIAKATANI